MKLLQENKLSKYLLYAFGEIILVMFGILLALQVNNLNNERKDHQLEVKYLNGLKSDLQMDLVNLKAFIIDKEIKYLSAMKLMEMSDPETITEIHEMDSIIWNVFVWKRYNQSTNTLDELIGSGNLSLIKNDSIKNKILDIRQANILIAGGTEHMRREYDYYLYDRSAELREIGPFLDFRKSISSGERVYILKANGKRLETLKKQAHTILHDLTFHNGLMLAVGNNAGMKERCENLYAEVEQLITLIDDELN